MADRRAQGGGAGDELSSALLRMRKAAGVSQTEAGNVAGLSQRTMSRIEAGLYLPAVDELAALLRQYEADRNVGRRLRTLLAAKLAEPPPKRFIARAGSVATIQHRAKLLENNANLIETFQPSCVIGLVQTEAYVRAVFNVPEVSDADESIAARLDRQRSILNSGKRVVLVHTEGALRHTLGSAGLMAEQLGRLAELAVADSNIRVGVIPTWQPLPRIAMSGFRLYDRRDLTVSSETGELFPPDQAVILEHVELFDRLTDCAEFGEPAAEQFERIAADYRRWRQ